jgi:formylglycine-generating enzyme required for sulfatase activity
MRNVAWALVLVAAVSVSAADELWSRLGRATDNTERTALIHDLPRTGVTAQQVVDQLRSELTPAIRFALILVLGEYDDHALASLRDSATKLMVDWYENDVDPGVHGAIAWLLGRWGQVAPLARVDRTQSGQPRANRRWFVTAEGQTMTVVPGPSTVRMGSPAGEPGREPASDSAAEPLHTVEIHRTFAIGAREVTRAEFERFLKARVEVARLHQYPDNPERMAWTLSTFSPEPDDPAIAVTWYEAAMYCNWLSEREGLPKSEWVYPPGPAAIRAGMELPVRYLGRTGYRLPTEAEWEFAARAGSTTSWFFGSSETLLGEYAWFARHPPRSKADPPDPSDPPRTSRVGLLKPNDLGLFDIYGNVWEWTQDRVVRHQSGDLHDDIEDDVRVVSDADARTRRGGAFPYEAAMARSAARGTVTSLPVQRRDNVGFRIARTLK